MGSVSGVIGFLIFSFGLLVSGKELWEKTQVEKIFLTPRLKIIHQFTISIVSAIYITFLISYFYLVIQIYFMKIKWEHLEWGNLMSICLFWFIVILVGTNPLIKTIRYLLIPYHVKYKLSFDDYGELYLIKMIDSEICICAKNPDLDLDNASDEFILLKKEDLMKVKLKRVEVDKPVKNKVLQLVSDRFYS